MPHRDPLPPSPSRRSSPIEWHAAAALAVSVAAIVVGFALDQRIDRARCADVVAGSQVQSRWSVRRGCEIRDAAGVWVPFKQYRAEAAR